MEEITETYINKDQSALETLIKKYSTNQLMSLLSKALKTQDDPSIFLGALLSGIKCENEVKTDRRLQLYICGLKAVLESILSSSAVSKLLGVLVLETESFPNSTLIEIFEKLITYGQSDDYSPGKWMELFPRVMTCLSTQGSVRYEEANMTGAVFLAKAIELLCTTKWNSKIIVNIAAILNDVDMTPEQVKFVIHSLLGKMQGLPFDNIPPLVFQLHLLCTKGCKNIFLNGVVDYFNETERKILSKKPPENNEVYLSTEDLSDSDRLTELKQTEGTVLLHLLLAVKSDQDLGSEFVKWLKANRLWPTNILKPFTMSLAFCFANVIRFKKQIFDLLKMAILQNSKETLLHKKSSWIRNFVSSDCCVNEIMNSIVQSASGWDYVTQSLIEFGFHLLDTNCTPSAQGKACNENTKTKQMACSIGSAIISNAFKNIRSVRQSIITDIINGIAPTELSLQQNYIKLFSETISLSPYDYLLCISKVKELLDCLVWLPVELGTKFLNAIQPLLKRNSSLRDSVMLALKKMLIYKDVTTRTVAVNGALICLKHFRNIGQRLTQQESQSSQMESESLTVDIHLPSCSSKNEVLGLELLTMLRRCFSQQAELRIKLYLGFPTILKQNAFLIDTVLELLLSQANIVVEAGAMPPIHFKNCVQTHGAEIVYMEPLPYLLCCISECLAIAKARHSSSDELTDEDNSLNSWYHPLSALIEDFRSAVIKMEVDDFELERYYQHSPTTVLGDKFFPKMLLSVYESLMEYSVVSEGSTLDMVETVMDLFSKHKTLTALMKKTSANPKKKKDDATAEKSLKSNSKNANTSNVQEHVFSSKLLISLLELLVEDENPDHHDAARELQRQTDFINLVVSAVEEKIANVHHFGYLASENELDLDDSFNFCCLSGNLIFRQLIRSEGEKTNLNEITLDSKFIECLQSTFLAVANRYPTKVLIFIKHLAKDKTSDKLDLLSNEQALENVIKKLEGFVIVILSSADNKLKHKQLGSLFTIISQVADHIEVDSPELLTKTYEWVENLCLIHSVDDCATAKSIFSLFLNLSKVFDTHLSSLKMACSDLLAKMGTRDEVEVDAGTAKKFNLVTELNCSVILLVVAQNVDSFLSDIEWIISKLKTKYESNGSNINDEQDVWQAKICLAVQGIATCLLRFLYCNLITGQCEDAVIKLTTHFYLVLQELVKYFTMLCKLNIKVSPQFEKLVGKINPHLTPRVYELIAFNQEDTGSPVGRRKKVKTNATVVKAGKESVLIPTLVYNIEQYERFLIKLAKTSKVNLTANMKLSTNRDFRIDPKKVGEVIQMEEEHQQSNDEQENEHEETESTPKNSVNRNVQPPSKRPRLSLNKKMAIGYSQKKV